ncbi:MAG: ABC transporter permease [Acidobacteria bacterium]|nr:ABC transporter permease [Acidobacteriota bacterium]
MRMRRIREAFRNNFALKVGVAATLLVILMALLAPVVAPHHPSMQYDGAILEKPSGEYLLGTDELGRDVLSRILYGARVSLRVGFSVVLIASSIGILLGAMSGYFGGILDTIIMRISDILLAFPGILLAIALVAVLGPSLNNVVFALSIVGWVGYARLVRGQVLKVREMEFVTAAEALGARSPRVILWHVLPNVINPVIVMATLGLAGAILAEAALSFLGLGVQPPTPSWGSMLDSGRQYIGAANHLTIFPGVAIMIAVMGLNFLGDGMIDAFDPKYRKTVKE